MLITSLLVALVVAHDLSQPSPVTVRGRITDIVSSAPVAAAQVVIQGTRLGTLTDDDGRYRIANLGVGRRPRRRAGQGT
ncbi:MAG: carboxypeptidase-like regulatory domain-containing protein [Gemmatimonadaceae bacterium]|nr:carboxypeptidase-like regulatory domain-containing protein [Gemmatimonadaceae bacterium]